MARAPRGSRPPEDRGSNPFPPAMGTIYRSHDSRDRAWRERLNVAGSNYRLWWWPEHVRPRAARSQ
jgi:hypothetical protein